MLRQQNIVISCFDHTTSFVIPWAEAGYLCYCIDIQHERGEQKSGNIIKIGADINCWIPPRGHIVFAAFFPPCTDLAVSGARWFKEKGLHRLAEAIKLFARCVDIAKTLDCPFFIENPVSTISTYWRKPDYSFDPYEYAGYSDSKEAYTKKTCLWVGNNFKMPEKNIVAVKHGSKMHRLPPSKNRANLRSVTPSGFSKAVYLANRVEDGNRRSK